MECQHQPVEEQFQPFAELCGQLNSDPAAITFINNANDKAMLDHGIDLPMGTGNRHSTGYAERPDVGQSAFMVGDIQVKQHVPHWICA